MITLKMMLDELFNAYENQTADTYFQSIRNKFTRGILCSNEQQEAECQAILDDYENVKLYAYIDNELVPPPEDKMDKLIEMLDRLGRVVCLEAQKGVRVD